MNTGRSAATGRREAAGDARRTAPRTAAGVLVLAAGLLVASLAAPGERDLDARRDLHVLQYNLCGAAAACPWNAGGSGPGTSVARLVREVVRLAPDVVTVNEICLTQYRALKDRLAASGRPMDGTYASSQDNVPACGASGRFGTAVLSREDVPDGRHHPFTHTGAETYTNGGRTVRVRRGVLCADTRFAGERLVACTAHTYSGAPEQLQEIADRTAGVPPDVPVVLAGDLNVPPGAPALAPLTHRFTEADGTDAEPTAGGRKIDYVFAARRHFTAAEATVHRYPESDHALLHGRFTATAGRRTGRG